MTNRANFSPSSNRLRPREHRPMKVKNGQKSTWDAASLSLLLAASLAGGLFSTAARGEALLLPELDSPHDYRGYPIDAGSGWYGAENAKGLGDVTGNGRGDIGFFLQGSDEPGRVVILPGRPTGQRQVLAGHPDGISVTLNPDLYFSAFYLNATLAGGGDITGNDFDDLVVGLPGYADPFTESEPGALVIIEGPLTSDIEISQATLLESSQLHLIRGPQPEFSFSNFGWDIAMAGDFNGDGLADILVGDAYGTDNGKVHVIFGASGFSSDSLEGLLENGDAIEIQGGGLLGRIGQTFAPAGDFNGDGIDDIILANRWGGEVPDAPYAYDGDGLAVVVFGSEAPQSFSFDDPETAMDHLSIAHEEEPGQGAQLGAAVSGIGDFNGDGFMDVAVGIPGDYDAIQSKVAVILGGPSTPGEVIHANESPGRGVVYTLENDGMQGPAKDVEISGRIGRTLAAVGDVNGDGFADLLIGGAGDGESFGKSGHYYGAGGQAFLVFGADAPVGGALEGILDDSLPGVVFGSGGTLGSVGQNVAGIGEVSGDMRGDMLISAWELPDEPYVVADAAKETASTDPSSLAYVVFSSPLPPRPEIFTLDATATSIDIGHSGVTNPANTVGAIGTWYRIAEPGPQPWVYMGLTTYLGGETFMAVPWDPEADVLYEIAARPRDGFGWVGDYVYTEFGEAPAGDFPSGTALSWDEDAQAAVLTFEEAGSAGAFAGFWSRPIARETDPGATTHALGGWTYYGLTEVPPLATSVTLDFLRGSDVYQLAAALRNPGGAGFLDTRDVVAVEEGTIINPRPGGIVFPPAGGGAPAVLFDPVGNNPDVAVELEYRAIDTLGKATVTEPWQAWRSGGYMDGPFTSPRRIDAPLTVPPLGDSFMEYEFRARLVGAEFPHAPVTGNLELNNKVPFKATGTEAIHSHSLLYYASNWNTGFGASHAVLMGHPNEGTNLIYTGAPTHTDDAGATGALFARPYRADGAQLPGGLITNHSPFVTLGLPPGAEFGFSVTLLGLYGAPPAPRLLVGAPGVEESTGGLWILDMDGPGLQVLSARAITPGGDEFPTDVAEGMAFGASLATLGDLNGDGNVEVAVGAPGQLLSRFMGSVHVLSFSEEGRVVNTVPLFSEEDSRLIDESITGFGYSLAFLGDVLGDGTPVLAVSSGLGLAEENGVHLVALNPDGTARDMAPLDHFSFNPFFGISLSGGMDLDGDGVPDLVVGEPDLGLDGGDDLPADKILDGHGGVRVFALDGANLGGVRGEALLEGDAAFGVNPGDGFGIGTAISADLLDAGGLPTLLVGAPFVDARSPGEGRAIRFALDFRTDALNIPRHRTDETETITMFRNRSDTTRAPFSLGRLGGFPASNDTTYLLGFPGDGAFGSVLLTTADSASELPRSGFHRLTPGSSQALAANPDHAGMRFGTATLPIPGMGGPQTPFIVVGAPGFTPESAFAGSGVIYVIQMGSNGVPIAAQRHGAFDFLSEYLDAGAAFGSSLAYIGPSTVQGTPAHRVAVGAPGLGDSQTESPDTGAILVLDLHATDGALLAVREIRNGNGLPSGTVAPGGRLGESLHALPEGPWEIESSTALAAGVPGQDTVLFLGLSSAADVTALASIEPGSGSFQDAPAPPLGRFGATLGGIGDFDGDGIPDLLVGMPGDPGGSLDTGEPNPGALYLLLLNRDLTVRYWKKIERATALAEGPQGLLRLVKSDEADLGGAFLTLPGAGTDGIFKILLGGQLDSDKGPMITKLTLEGTPMAP